MAELEQIFASNVNYFLIIDVLLVAALFYYLLLSARRTKVMIVLQAIIFLGLMNLVCKTFRLDVLAYIIQGVFVVGPLALCIIFAPEIREFLDRAGKQSRLVGLLLQREPIRLESSVLEALLTASAALAEKRTGGLIVIGGAESVEEHLVPGTVLDAVPSHRFLVSIFDKHNPLHDGAIVITQERVHSVGNFLPISENTHVAADLGTRHRAALGLSERCDAVVIVISEERGELSIAHQGRLARALSKEQFDEQLTALVEPNENFTTLTPHESLI